MKAMVINHSIGPINRSIGPINRHPAFDLKYAAWFIDSAYILFDL